MSSNTNWDVDKYKTEHECEEHWQLRRRFLVANQNKFPEERLVCLAQVFTNIEFLGCRYPQETMELVAELSEGVADDYREQQKSKLQRTFVKASDAAGAKVKGLKRTLGDDATGPSDSAPKISKHIKNAQLPQNTTSTTLTANITPSNSLSSDTLDKNFSVKGAVNSNSEEFRGIKTCAFVRATEITKTTLEEKRNQECNNQDINGSEGNSVCKPLFEDQQMFEARNNRKSNRKLKKGLSRMENCRDLDSEMVLINAGRFGRLILIEGVEDNNQNILIRSTTHCNIPFQIKCEDNLQESCCKIIVNRHLVVSVSDKSKKIAQDIALNCAVDKLRNVCYTLKVKKQRVPDDLVVDMAMITTIELNTTKESRACVPKAAALATPLPEDNVGSKLMRSMGWTGGGLGKTEQGIQEPVSVSLRINRAGLGAQKKHVDADFKAKVRIFLMKYIIQDFPPSLIFKSDEFFTMEREVIHKIAFIYGLQSARIGRGDDTYLKIFRKDSYHTIASIMLSHGVYSDEFCDLLAPRISSSVYFHPECLQASDFPHFSQQESSSTVGIENEQCGPEPPESNVIGGNLEKLIMSLAKKERKRERQKEKSCRRAASRRSMRIREQHQKQGANQTKLYSLEAIAAGPYGSFFLIEYENAYDHKGRIMADSAQHNFIPVKYQYGSFKTGAYCSVFVNNHLLTTSCGFNKKEARTLAIDEAYEKLKQICYVLKIKPKINSAYTVVEKNESWDNNHTEDKLNQPLEDNVGSKLMRAMGWTGGGLGKEQQGIKEPIRVELKVNRTGLGLKDKDVGRKVFEAKITEYLREYTKQQGEAHDLVFSSEFTKIERAFMHRVCLRLGLKSKSYGKDDDRRLVVSYRKDFCSIVQDMLRSGEYSTPCYELIKPPISLPLDTEVRSHPECESNVKSEDTVVNPTESQCRNASGDFHVVDIVKVSLENENSSATGQSSVSKSGLAVQGVGDVLLQKPNINELTGPFGLLVLIEDETVVTPIQLIERSANACHIPFKFEYANVRGGMICRLLMNNVLVTSSTEISKKRAREVTVNNGITKLKDVCFSLKIQNKEKDKTFSVIKCLRKPNKNLVGIANESEARIVCVSKEINWSLLGIKNGGKGAPQLALKNIVRSFLRNYQAEICPYDLTISPDFPAELSSFIQKTASGLALKTMKYELLENSFVVISKKLSIIELAKAMLTSGGNASAASI